MWLAKANRAVAALLTGVGLFVAGVGLYLGFFAWLNSGMRAGVELFAVAVGVATGFVLSALAFRIIANAHAAKSRKRWWLQVLLPLAAWALFIVPVALISSLFD